MENSAPSNTTTTTTLFNTDFCLLLTNQILHNEAEKGTNFVASPLCLHVMLGLIAAGSKGQTLQQLLHFLGSTDVGDLTLLSSTIINLVSPAKEGDDDQNLAGGPLLSFVNGAWLDQRFTLNSSFQGIVNGSYKAQLKSVDFATKAGEVVEEVNSWAESATKGLIKQLLPFGSLKDENETALVLANAFYFKGAWQKKFDPAMTQLRDFHLLNEQIIQAPFMTAKRSTQHLYGSFDGYKVVQIPYQSGQDPRKLSMYFFLPNEKEGSGLFNLIQTLKLNPGLLYQQFKLRLEELSAFWIPKFRFSFEIEASETMKEMGLKLPFEPGELTEMVDSPNSDELCVSDIFHKSFIEVNEEGTEAAASTGARMIHRRIGRRNIPSFVADHPFLFMIREETHGVVFFIGAVLNPLQDA